MSKNSAKFGKDPYHYNAYDLISTCCHFDEKTLLTKNGELVQVIQINGINSKDISDHLADLREIIRSSIRENVDSSKIACWIHTIRRKTNLDDPQRYPNLMSQNIHNLWVKKNFWHDKFVNTLYISFVYQGLDFGSDDPISLVTKFNAKRIIAEHDAYLNHSRQELEDVIGKIERRLNEFGCRRLGIVFKGEEAYCEMISFYHSLVSGSSKLVPLTDNDISRKLGDFKYAVGSDKIEIKIEDKTKYISIISFKEYHELSSASLDKFLQLPMEFIITEVLYFIDPKEIKAKLDHQAYIAKVSLAEEILDANGTKQIYDAESKYMMPYCNQQISMAIYDEKFDNLDNQTEVMSFRISKLGLVHVREDVNIENYFWSQLPGNFKYLRRKVPVSVDTIASLASLHNFPAGENHNPWGRSVTILRTEKGTPFFFNFHSKSEAGRCLLIGAAKSGKTTIANFLISEAMKFDPKVLFIAATKESYVFIKGNGGVWIEEPFRIDPFKIKSVIEDHVKVIEYIRVMSGDHLEPLNENEKKSLEDLTRYFLAIPDGEKSINKLSEFDFAGEAGQSLKLRMKDYLPDGEYYTYFQDDGRWENEVRKVMTIDFFAFSDEAFNNLHYPSEDRLLPAYYKKYKKFATFREIFATINVLKFADHFAGERQIIKIENFNTVCSALFTLDYYRAYFNKVCRENIIYINSLKFAEELPFFKSELWDLMNSLFETKIYLSAETVTHEWQKLLQLSDKDYQKLKLMLVSSRLFLVNQDNDSVTCELSLGGYLGLLRLLLADKKLVEKCDEIIARKGEDPKEWLIEFYDSIR